MVCRKRTLFTPPTRRLWRHDAAGHELVGARIEEQKAADMYGIPVCNGRHSAQLRPALLEGCYRGRTSQGCEG